MKILLIGEYSNVHATLARGLRAAGHQAIVVSDGDGWKDYERDIDVSRDSSRLGGARLLLRLLRIRDRLKGYDVVQLINPMFFELKAERLFAAYHWLRRHNRCVILCGFGMDWYWVRTCIVERPLRYSDFNIGDRIRTDEAAERERRDWMGTAKERLNRQIAADCDGIVTGLYEYHVCYHRAFPRKTRFIPFPIEMPQPVQQAEEVQGDDNLERGVDAQGNRKLKLFIGISRNRSAYKGTDIMLRAAEDVVSRYPDCVELTIGQGIPFAEYQQVVARHDVLLDQLYSYTPAMNALMAMSQGVVVVGGGEPENYDILGEQGLRPIINVEPTYESVYEELCKLVLHPERIPLLKHQSVDYVRRHHDLAKVTEQYLEFYNSVIDRLSPAAESESVNS